MVNLSRPCDACGKMPNLFLFLMLISINAHSKDDAFVVKVADELEDTIKLMELGFEFHTEIAGHKVFRKRK